MLRFVFGDAFPSAINFTQLVSSYEPRQDDTEQESNHKNGDPVRARFDVVLWNITATI